MDISLADPNGKPLPPEDVRILDLKVEPYPDVQRIRLLVKLTPFQKKPSGDISLTNQDGEILTTTSIIEAVTPNFELTLHLRVFQPGDYLATMNLLYPEEIQDKGTEGALVNRSEKIIADEATIRFKIPDLRPKS